MYPLIEPPKRFSEINQRSRQTIAEIWKHCEKIRKSVAWPENKGLSFSKGELYFIQKSSISCTQAGNLILIFEEGDLVGLPHHFCIENARYGTGDLPANVDVILMPDLTLLIKQDAELQRLWQEYLSLQAQLVFSLLGNFLKAEKRIEPEFRNFDAGQVIIQQGSKAPEVYTMMEGHAEVFVDEVKVGDVDQGEIFGALAALTDSPRLGSVRATQNCMVHAIATENFLDLVQSRPAAVLKMVQGMAKTIKTMNEKVVTQDRLLKKV